MFKSIFNWYDKFPVLRFRLGLFIGKISKYKQVAPTELEYLKSCQILMGRIGGDV